MIRSVSGKRHDVFDLSAAARIYAESKLDRDLDGDMVTSPYHLYSVETLRDRLGLRIGRAVPTDVIVYGKGEPTRREVTKVGGMPYWPRGREWPRSADGSPRLFLAQFCFADSRDLAGLIPGDVLVMLVRDAERWPYQEGMVDFEWFPLGLDLIDTFDPRLCAVSGGPFFGTIHRTFDYPDAVEAAQALSESNEDLEWWDLPIINGTKIGGLPGAIQGEGELEGDLLCQLGSIQPHPDVPYAWINSPRSLAIGHGDDGIFDNSNMYSIVDMGSLYIHRLKSGQLRPSTQFY